MGQVALTHACREEITNPGGNATGSGIDHVNFLPDQPSQKGWKFVFPTSEFQCRIPHVTRLQSTLAKINTKLVCCMEDAKGIQSCEMTAYLGPVKSKFLCLWLGPVGSSSTPMTEDGFTNTKYSLIKYKLLWCIFSRAPDESNIISAFRQAQVFLSHIWNYNPTIFFNIPQTALENHRSTTGGDQYTALKFIKKNKSPEHNQIHDLWSHPNNNWIQNTCDPSNLQLEATHGFSRFGSILANDMGLGKTSSTLALILGTNSMARRFQMMNQDSKLV
ncbi:hypothetical protein MJO28_016961 [Puccinia striiformis f. sp. tritici]|nr:hypothetical protein MJO28_016961 [Puccinia striiformis f. sp. tritici]